MSSLWGRQAERGKRREQATACRRSFCKWNLSVGTTVRHYEGTQNVVEWMPPGPWHFCSVCNFSLSTQHKAQAYKGHKLPSSRHRRHADVNNTEHVALNKQQWGWMKDDGKWKGVLVKRRRWHSVFYLLLSWYHIMLCSVVTVSSSYIQFVLLLYSIQINTL